MPGHNFRFVLLILLLTLFQSQEAFALSKGSKRPVDYVNPMIGTGAHGHTYPGATLPFGMIQLSPDNGKSGWDWCSGYNYSDSLIIGFSHTHLSGTGCGDLCDILITPTVNKFNPSKNILIDSTYDVRSRFSHNDEKALPGYYSVILKDYNVKAELTATLRAGMHRYTFPESKASAIVVDLGYAINWDAPTETKITVEDNTTVSGYRYSKGWAKDERIFFVIKFSKPFEKFALGNGPALVSGNKMAEGKNVKAVLGYSTKANEKILAQIAISYVSIEGAKNNLKKEISTWDFDKVSRDCLNAWNKELNTIDITTKDEKAKRTFYTALYHSKLAPVIFSDADGKYRGADGKIHTQKGFQNYSIFSLWDTFRALHPLMTIVDKDKVSDMINSMLAYYHEYGALPDWPLMGNETNTMIGIHSVPVIADAYFKGIKGFDALDAYEAIKASALQDNGGQKFLREYNYIPSDKEKESVSKTVELAFDYWCIAQMAKALNKASDYEMFTRTSLSYRNLFDSSTCFMRGKLSNGKWVTPFDPVAVDHRNNDFTEGNAWHYLWFVPHNLPDLIRLMGGNEKFSSKLDSLFTTKEEIRGENVSPDISGLIGQYVQGNEPCHHVAYLYNYAGEAWKTQQRVRNILSIMFKDTPEGLPGNEDCGQMSAWYILSAIGFYPVNPASGVYDIGSPLFDKVTLSVNKGKKFEVIAENNLPGNIYIQSAKLNGKDLETAALRYDEIMNGGKLVFEMGPAPNKLWGRVPVSSPLYQTGK